MRFRNIALAACFCAVLIPALARANSSTPAPQVSNTITAIPYKQEAQSFPAQSLSALLVTLALLCATVVGLQYLKKHLQKGKVRSFLNPSMIQVKERLRLNTKLTIYVVTYRNKEILMAQAGDCVAALAEFPEISSAAPADSIPQKNG